MPAFSGQRGVTLIEVLVGFVIFTSSLVAVLNYVSQQVYQNRLSTTNLQKIEIIYEQSRIQQADLGESQLRPPQGSDYNLTVSAATTASFTANSDEVRLNRYRYSVSDRDNALDWAVFRVE
jgi:Tfp pilus assembly protein PilV